MNMRRAVYPGSFDPVHYGHIDIVTRAARVFGEVIVAVYDTPPKKVLFSVEERVAILQPGVKRCAKCQGCALYRIDCRLYATSGSLDDDPGLRVFSDFEFGVPHGPGKSAACAGNRSRELHRGRKALIHQFFHRSARLSSLGGDVTSMVPPELRWPLRAKFSDPNRDGAGTNYVVSLQD